MLAICNEIGATFGRLLAYACGVAALVALTARMFGVSGVEAAIEPPARPNWINIERPHRAFALTFPELTEAGYTVRRHPTRGGRKDTMTWGEAEAESSRLMVEIYRPGAELERFSDPASEIAMRTADIGAPAALTPAETIDTKFGPVALVDFLAKHSERSRHCLGFVRTFDEPRLQIAGWYCKAHDEIINHAVVACALDRLAVVAAGSDPKIAELFAHAELKRKFCDTRYVVRGTTLKRNDWIAATHKPRLRGRHVTR